MRMHRTTLALMTLALTSPTIADAVFKSEDG